MGVVPTPPGATASPWSSPSASPGPSARRPHRLLQPLPYRPRAPDRRRSRPAVIGRLADRGSASTGGGDPEGGLPTVRFDERRLDLAGASIGLFSGVEIWAVPAATIAVPGLLVLIWVALQAAGAIAWMPAVRRLQGRDEPRQRRRFGNSSH